MQNKKVYPVQNASRWDLIDLAKTISLTNSSTKDIALVETEGRELKIRDLKSKLAPDIEQLSKMLIEEYDLKLAENPARATVLALVRAMNLPISEKFIDFSLTTAVNGQPISPFDLPDALSKTIKTKLFFPIKIKKVTQFESLPQVQVMLDLGNEFFKNTILGFSLYVSSKKNWEYGWFSHLGNLGEENKTYLPIQV